MVVCPIVSIVLAVALLDGRCHAAPSSRPVPKEVLEGASAATKVLGQEVLKGNFSYSIQRMYPRWRKRAAKRIGGDDKLERKLMAIPEQMRKNGIKLLKFEVGEPTAGHEVFLLRGQDDDGNPVQAYLEWLVFVPTRSEYRVIDPLTRQVKRIETKGFQVAIVKKGAADWYFIDGSNLTIPELRSFFPGLPEDRELLGLPPVGGGELKN